MKRPGAGHLGVLQWARAHGCPWEARTCLLAAEEGHQEVLQWAIANGCPWHRTSCASGAAARRHFWTKNWILSLPREEWEEWQEWA